MYEPPGSRPFAAPMPRAQMPARTMPTAPAMPTLPQQAMTNAAPQAMAHARPFGGMQQAPMPQQAMAPRPMPFPGQGGPVTGQPPARMPDWQQLALARRVGLPTIQGGLDPLTMEWMRRRRGY